MQKTPWCDASMQKKSKGRKDGKKEKDKKMMFKCILVHSHVIVDGYVIRENVAVAFKESRYFVWLFFKGINIFVLKGWSVPNI